MNLLVCGGRSFSDGALLYRTLDVIHKQFPVTVLIHGAASGADSLADQWARAERIEDIRPFPAQWGVLGKSAGPIRNLEMLKVLKSLSGDKLVVAFPGGLGTKHMVESAVKNSITVMSINSARR